MKESESCKLLILLPSLRISGGNKEALRLAEDLQGRGIDVEVVTLWSAPHELSYPGMKRQSLSSFVASRSTAIFQYPLLLARYIAYVRRLRHALPDRRIGVMLTHFSTFMCAWLTPHLVWYCFNQDVEWMFVREGLFRKLLRKIILATSRRAVVVTTNEYIDRRYRNEGVRTFGIAAIWPSNFWLSQGNIPNRRFDIVVFLRRGHMKRLDLYLDFLKLLRGESISCVAITPDSDIHEEVAGLPVTCHLRPTNEEIRTVYGQAKVFLLLSDTEGFGLPPLEAMGSGCVPFCRDSGGPRSYMRGSLLHNLVPLETPSGEILSRLKALLADPERLSTLSEESKRLFSEGLTSVETARAKCLAELAALMQRGHPDA